MSSSSSPNYRATPTNHTSSRSKYGGASGSGTNGNIPPSDAAAGATTTVETVSARNKMGLLGCISYMVGNIVGSGIFITPTAILLNTNSVGFSLAVWVLTGAVAMLGAFSYIELGTAIHESGCDFAYACYVRWYALAFCYMCVGTMVHYPAVIAIQAQTFSEYLFSEFHTFIEERCIAKTGGFVSIYMARKLVEVAVVMALTYLNFFSLRRIVARFNIVASTAKVMATASVIGIGFYFLFIKGQGREHFHEPFKNSTYTEPHKMISAIFAGLFSYDGWDILNFGAEEIAHPKRNLPLAIIIGIVLVCAIYVCINVAYFTILTVPQFIESQAVAGTFIRESIGGDWAFLMPIMVCILLIGSLNATIFVTSRFLHAPARAGFLPTFVSCTNMETDSPRAALVIQLLLVFTMTFTADLHALINYIGFAQWSQRGITMIVLFWLRYKFTSTAKHPRVVRAPLIVPILFFIICSSLVVVTIVTDTTATLLCLSVLFVTYVIYMLFIYKKSLPSVHAYRVLARELNSITTSFTQVLLNTMPQRLKPMASEPGVEGDDAGPNISEGEDEEDEEGNEARNSSEKPYPQTKGEAAATRQRRGHGTKIWDWKEKD